MFNWFKKKEEVEEIISEEEIEEPEETSTTIFKRLEELETRLWELQSESFVIYKYYSFNSRSLSMHISTKLGERKFRITKDCCSISTSVTTLTTSTSYELTMYNKENKIFSVTAYKNSTKVEPIMIRDDLTSKEIDLAIYELEQFVDKFYREHKDRQEFHNEEVKKLEV